MRKPLGHYVTLPRIPLVSHLQAAHYISIGDYTPTHAWQWATNVGKYFFKRKHPFVVYPPGSTGIYPIPNETTLGMAGDWATGTEEAARVAARMNACDFDYTVHLGDVYYVGGQAEVDENFLGIQSSSYEPTKFALARHATFALLGNHDMYADGSGYFDTLLPALGQTTSYFCLQNDHWRIIGLDTGYNSGGIEIDGIIKPSCKLPDPVITWLYSLNLDKDDRGIIFLSHHGPWSAFNESSYPEPAKQLAPFVNRPVLWFWGHEHRMAIYEKFCITYEGVQSPWAFGRMVGNGGMPIKLKRENGRAPVQFTDKRLYPNSENLSIGFNGYADLRFSKESLSIDYKDLNDLVVFTEIFNPQTLV